MALQMISKMEFAVQFHESLLENVDWAQKKQKRTYVTRKGRVMFHSFGDGEVSIKMQKLGKKKSFLASQEGPYPFASYKDGKGCQEQDERIIIVFSRTKKAKLGKEQIKICKFIIPLEVLIYEDIDFLCGSGHICDLQGALK